MESSIRWCGLTEIIIIKDNGLTKSCFLNYEETQLNLNKIQPTLKLQIQLHIEEGKQGVKQRNYIFIRECVQLSKGTICSCMNFPFSQCRLRSNFSTKGVFDNISMIDIPTKRNNLNSGMVHRDAQQPHDQVKLTSEYVTFVYEASIKIILKPLSNQKHRSKFSRPNISLKAFYPTLNCHIHSTNFLIQ